MYATLTSTVKFVVNMSGDDYEGYRGHIYRVLTYALHFLDESPSYQSVIGIALVYHDIGLWTNGTLNYLEPSCKKAKYDMKKQKMSPTDVNLVQDIIYWHHKVTEYESDAATADTVSSPSLSYSKISAIKNDKIINAVRKADLIDFSFGIIKYGMPKEYIQFVQKKIPDAGFHKTLLLFAPKLYGYQVWRYPEIVGIFKF